MTRDSERRKFQELYEEHARLVRSVLHRMVLDESLLDDLVQETFIRIWNSLPKFAARSSVRTWVYRIAVNVALDHSRKRKVRKEEAFESEYETASNGEAFRLESQGLLIREALLGLDDSYRSVITLHYFEGLDLKTISEVLEIPVGTVKSRLHSGREKLKALLKERGVDDGQW